ncbi:MAG: hypothetical protein NUV46_02190 [Nanoarchaeota archaeon]|nr:hypothetical protein [Nanoarchaeota archaeon]
MELNQKSYIYLVGKFYDTSFESEPNPESNYDLIIYDLPQEKESRAISSLEGIFVTEKEFLGFFLKGKGNPVCRRNQVKEFEERYSGKFYFNQ